MPRDFKCRSGGFDELAGLFQNSSRRGRSRAGYAALAASYRAKGNRLQAECVMHMSRHHLIKSLNEQANAAAWSAHRACVVQEKVR